MKGKIKRFRISALLLGTVLLLSLVFGSMSTGANFSDEESATGNISGGTMNLVITSETFNVPDLLPGQSASRQISMEAKGTAGGVVKIKNISINQSGGTTNDSEKETDPDNNGDLGQLINVTMTCGGTVVYNGSLSGMDGQSGGEVAVNSGDTVVYDLYFEWPSNADDNKGQGDKATLTFTFLEIQN